MDVPSQPGGAVLYRFVGRQHRYVAKRGNIEGLLAVHVA